MSNSTIHEGLLQPGVYGAGAKDVTAVRRITNAWAIREAKETNARIREAYGIDLTDNQHFTIDEPFGPSIKQFREAVRTQVNSRRTKLGEAGALSSFGAVLAAGISNIANEQYIQPDITYDQVCGMNTSTLETQPYAPIQLAESPTIVPDGAPFPERRLPAPIQVMIQNLTIGGIVSVQKNLIDDDQTGQVQRRAQNVGSQARNFEEAFAAQRMVGTAGPQLGTAIPASATNYGEAIAGGGSWPWSTSLMGGGQNRLTTYAVISQENLQLLYTMLMVQKDFLGNLLGINPDVIYSGVGNKFIIDTILQSQYYVSTVAQHVVPGTGTAGVTATNVGTSFAKNVMQGLFKVAVNRYLPSGFYSVGKAGSWGLVYQLREAFGVVQESPDAGDSFSMNLLRFRNKQRYNID